MNLFGRLGRRGRITEDDLETALREVRIALLEADVNFQVVRDFIARIRERALGTEVLQSITPGQQVIGVVNEELVEILGGDQQPLLLAEKGPTTVLIVGVQGSGKTTLAARMAMHLRGEGLKPAKTFLGLDIEDSRDMVLLLIEAHLSRGILEKLAETCQFDESPGSGIASGIGTMSYGAQVIVDADTGEQATEAAVARLQEAGVPVLGASDHTVTHSLYIQDPDGNEIELYIDVQPEAWRDDPGLVFAPIKPLKL